MPPAQNADDQSASVARLMVKATALMHRKPFPWVMYPIASVLEIDHGLARAVDAACPNRPGPALRRREHSTSARAPGPHPGRTGREGQPWGSSRAQHRAWRRECDSGDLGCNCRRPWGSSWLALAQGDSSTPPARPPANTAIGKTKFEKVGRCVSCQVPGVRPSMSASVRAPHRHAPAHQLRRSVDGQSRRAGEGITRKLSKGAGF